MTRWGGRRTAALRAQVLEAYGSTCWLCGGPGATTVDHVVPRSRGGDPWDLANCRPAHGSCNYSRGNRPPARRETRRANGDPYPAPTRSW